MILILFKELNKMFNIFILICKERWEKIKVLKNYKGFDIYSEYIFNPLPFPV